MVNTFVATAAAALSWLFVEWGAKGKPSLLGMVSGAVAGLVAVTPASGFAGPMGSIVLGLVAGAVCFVFCSTVKNALGYDDSLDVFGIHCVGGILGALATGILVNPWLGGAGIPDYEAKPGELALATYAFGPAMINQIKAVLMTLCWSGHRLGDPLQGRRRGDRPARHPGRRTRRPRPRRPRRARVQLLRPRNPLLPLAKRAAGRADSAEGRAGWGAAGAGTGPLRLIGALVPSGLPIS